MAIFDVALEKRFDDSAELDLADLSMDDTFLVKDIPSSLIFKLPLQTLFDKIVSGLSGLFASLVGGYVPNANINFGAPSAIGNVTPNTAAFTNITYNGQLTSTIAVGTPPIVVLSTTNVPLLNASSLNGATFAAPGAIGGGTASTGAFTGLSYSGQLTSTVAIGTAPFVVTSTTQVANLNVSQLIGGTWAVPGAIGSTTRNSAAVTVMNVNVSGALETGTQCTVANTNSTEYSLPTLWLGHSSQKDVSVYNGGPTGASGAGSVLFVNTKNTSTSRSINAAGTINASGADYAEYMTKCKGCGAIKKGQIVGITVNGEITDKWSLSIAFAVKSTDPSYVGGDIWSNAQAIGERPNVDEIEAMTEYETRLEAARQTVDRIAFAGQVPCNVMHAIPKHYIVPIETLNDCILGVSVESPTLQEYMISVGRVIALESDGRARIVVKIG